MVQPSIDRVIKLRSMWMCGSVCVLVWWARGLGNIQVVWLVDVCGFLVGSARDVLRQIGSARLHFSQTT